LTGLFGWPNKKANNNKNKNKGAGAKLLKEFKSRVKEKRYNEALHCGSEYIRRIGDHNHDLFFTMGAICHMQKRYTTAISYLDRALEIGSYDTEALLLKAEAHIILGEPKKAIRCCEMILEVDPKHKRAMQILEQNSR